MSLWVWRIRVLLLNTQTTRRCSTVRICKLCSCHWCLPVCHGVLLSRACLVKASALNPTCINAQSYFQRTKRRHRRLCFAWSAGNLADRISMWKGCTNAACPFAGNWRCEPTDPYKFLPLSQFRYRLDDAGFARTRSGQSQGKHPKHASY